MYPSLENQLEAWMALFPGYTRNKPRFAALAEALLRQAADLWALIPQLESGFSLSAAQGLQLDALGQSVSLPRQAGWTDETYRQVLQRRLKLFRWDGSLDTVKDFLESGETFSDNVNGSVTVHASAAPPVPLKEWFPVPPGIRAVSVSS